MRFADRDFETAGRCKQKRSTMIKIYVDESGTHADSDVTTVAAYAGRPKVWRKWTNEWRKAKRPIRLFHATDSANLHGEFEGWHPEKRDELVKKLLPIIANNSIAGAVIGLHLGEFRKAVGDRKEIPEALGNPYTTCFHWLVQSLLELLKHNKKTESFKFIHEQNDFEGEARAAFDFIKENANPHDVPMKLVFGAKKENTPLQAADILAYEGNKRFRDPDKPERKAWQALDPKNRIVAVQFGRENMGKLIDSIAQSASSAKSPKSAS
jgi:Protein of unknown function (DUF3800)